MSLEAGKDYQFTLECPVVAPPVISNVQLSGGENRVFLTYTTDRAVYGGADYNTPSQNNQSLAYGTQRGTQHQKAIPATASGNYRIKAKVKDEFNREVAVGLSRLVLPRPPGLEPAGKPGHQQLSHDLMERLSRRCQPSITIDCR